MNKTLLMATVLAVATVLATGLTVLPESVQEAQAQIIIPGSGSNPCNIDTLNIEAEEVGNNCDFYGNTEIDASSELPIIDRPPFPEELEELED
jgi:hypothetical protein